MLVNPWQTTLKSPIEFSGKGLHSGRVVRMVIEPALANTGIVFGRSDQIAMQLINACADLITTTQLSTTIGTGAHSISTIEHLMASLAGLGISNAKITVNGPELPIMDGSASAFVKGFMKVGIREWDVPAKALRLIRPFVLAEGDKLLRLEPSDQQKISCSICFRSRAIGSQKIEYCESLEAFLAIADARTFCHLSDVQAMREKGLALGGGLDNAIVVTETEVLNEDGLRSSDEFVKHKLLDLIGDFALLGAPLLAEIFAVKTGHALHAKAIQQIVAHRDLYLEEFTPVADLSSGRPWDSLARLPRVSYA